MDNLPAELLSQILNYPEVKFIDCCRLACTNKRFSQICSRENNELWKVKFSQGYEKLFQKIHIKATEIEPLWKDEVEARYDLRNFIVERLGSLSAKQYHESEMDDDSLQQFVDYAQNHKCQFAIYYEMDAIRCLLKDSDPNKQLTLKYYSTKVFRHLLHTKIKVEFEDYLSDLGELSSLGQGIEEGKKTMREVALEQNQIQIREHHNLVKLQDREVPGDIINGAVLLSQWFQPNIDIEKREIRRSIELMADLTVNELIAVYPSNKLVTLRAGKLLTDSEAFILSDSLYQSQDCKQILMCLNCVLFVQLKFTGNQSAYYDPENSFINRILDRRLGIPISMSILYQAVASKLGVKTLLVNNPGHFLVKWKQYPELEKASDQYTYIDVFHGGRFVSWVQLNQDYTYLGNEELPLLAKPAAVFKRMCSNLVEISHRHEHSNDNLTSLRNGLELMLIVDPQHIEYRLLLSRVYIHLNINLDRVITMLREISERDPASAGVVMFLNSSVLAQKAENAKTAKRKKLTQKLRRDFPEVKYAVGLVMKHARYHYTCVIYGWDSRCKASRDWIQQMGVHNLPNKDEQPFYNVLVSDGSARYAAEESLFIHPEPQTVSHLEVGRYFDRFEGCRYVPNLEKSNEYPEDQEDVREALLKEAALTSTNRASFTDEVD